MTIEEKTTYKATSLPNAPTRDTRAEAEADEARGIDLAAYLAVLPTLTREQWERVATWDRARGEAWNTEWAEAWDAAESASEVAKRDKSQDAVWKQVAAGAVQDAAWAALAIVVRDFITPEHFDTLTAPMRAADVNFDALTTGSGDPS